MTTLFLISTILILLLIPFYTIYKPPHLLIRYFKYRWPDVLWEVPVSKKTIALTLDDVPSQFTSEILEILDANHARATFFVIGAQAKENEEILEEIVKAGHELGNHAMHDQASRALSDEVLEDEIRAVEHVVQQAYDRAGIPPPPKYFRPGSGFFSKRMRALVQRLDYKLVLGNIYPHDPQIKYWRLNANHILSMLRPGGIIICHDRRSWTPPMLRRVLSDARRRGYQIVTLTELLREAG